MPGYGPSRRRSSRATVLAVVAATMLVGGCSLLTEGTEPSKIIVPPTDSLTTETSTSEVPTSEAAASGERDTNLPKWTIGRTVTAAPRVDNSRYHKGSVTADSALQTTSGFHFSTPSRSVNCSTGTNGRNTLACQATGTNGPTNPPANTPSTCQWAPDLIILNNTGASQGACANLYPVMRRGTIVGFGQSIAIARFTCLSDASGLYCLSTENDKGFAVTARGYRPIRASDPAPSSLLGTGQDPADTTENSPSESAPPTS